jgi:hypothetical protein
MKPWDMERLTQRELAALEEDMAALAKAAQQR